MFDEPRARWAELVVIEEGEGEGEGEGGGLYFTIARMSLYPYLKVIVMWIMSCSINLYSTHTLVLHCTCTVHGKYVYSTLTLGKEREIVYVHCMYAQLAAWLTAKRCQVQAPPA